MSTDYTLKGNPTRKRLEKALPGWTFADNPQDPCHLVARDPVGNYLHFYRTGKLSYGGMTRFGSNRAWPTIDALIEAGFRVTDECGEEL